MNILVIGNGFDLAHDLPTKYTDFLAWVKKYKQFYEYATGNRTAEYKETKEPILQYFNSLFYEDKNKAICNQIYNLVYHNIWIDYFLQCNMHGKDNWIDFESEISDFIKSIDDDMHGSNNEYSLYDDIEIHFSNDFLDSHSKFQECETFKEIRDILVEDLNDLIRALEIYLTDFVGQIECKSISPDIKEVIEKSNKCMIEGTEVHICQVICFNYTDTYEKLYLESRTTKNLIDYIHGKADISNTIESNNMVLGIDEFLSDDRKNKDIEFIAFKKFYQRIYKQTGCKYKKWVDEIKKDYLSYLQNLEKANYMERRYISDDMQRIMNNLTTSTIKDVKCPIHNLYIFGHSLDVTDKDILRDLILNDNVKTTIFYHSKDAMGQQIANLVKVIGQDELIKRTGGSTKTIEFVPQKHMEPIDCI